MNILKKPGWKRLAALVMSLGVVTAGMLIFPHSRDSGERGIQTQGETADQRIAFLAQFGWEVEPEPLEIRDIVIPEVFDEVYTRYNEIQKEQGMDLQPYAGKTCRQWIYRIINYPLSGEEVRAVMLVYEGMVIGGDISSVELDGFMTGFAGETGEGEVFLENAQEAQDTAAAAGEVAEDAWPTD